MSESAADKRWVRNAVILYAIFEAIAFIPLILHFLNKH